MLIKREDLLSILDQIKPALGSKTIIIGLDHLFFSQGKIYAYDGVVSIDAPFDLDFEGAVPGEIMIKFLASCATDEIKVEHTNQNLNMSSGRSRISLPIMSLDKSARDFPEIDISSGEKITEEFQESLSLNLISISKNSALAAYTGVLIDDIDIFSTDSRSLTWERQETIPRINNKILLPGAFCTQLLKLADKDSSILFTDGYVAMVNSHGTKLISRLLDPDNAPNFKTTCSKHLRVSAAYCPVPDNLHAALERIELVKSDRFDDPVKLEIKDNTLFISIKTFLGNVDDEIKLDADHPDIKIMLDSSLVLRALPKYKEFLITEGAFIFRNSKHSYHMISTFQL